MPELDYERGFWITLKMAKTHIVDWKLSEAIIKYFKDVKNVVDIGCGNGAYTKNFISHGIDCTGYDGNPYTPQITGGLCSVKDFSEPVYIGEFDLVLSLEVGEHIPKKYETNFIENLVRASKKHICLSWAVEGQGGGGHFNCRNNDYIIKRMEKKGFLYDQKASMHLRENSSADIPWFKNTIMVFYKADTDKPHILDVFKGYESNLVSVVLTSCGRFDCLMKTIESFRKFNKFPIHEFIICEDSGDKNMHGAVKELCPDATLILHKQNVGLVANIDSGYSRVKTPFVFHMEDDWEFYRGGFIEKSLEILFIYPHIMQVWIRDLKDTNGHPVEEKKYKAGSANFFLLETNVMGAWHGFSWNPGLRRMSDYKLVGPFNKIMPHLKAGEREMYIGIEFYRLGFRAAILLEGCCIHIGYTPKNYSLL